MIPVSAVIPTRHRPESLRRALSSLLAQQIWPAEVVVVDASSDERTRAVVEAVARRAGPMCAVRWCAAVEAGAAAQRNYGVGVSTQPFVWFCDDDIILKPHCVERLWQAVCSDTALGGVSATITNQQYRTPGVASRMLYRCLGARTKRGVAGRLIGPVVNVLPEDRDDLPEVVAVEWLNTTCTIYRKEALPTPPFDSIFTGYSLMEDVALSLRVGRFWSLANARTARIFHDSQPGEHKQDRATVAAMEVVNRHYVMTEILGRRRLSDYARLAVWEAFQCVACAVRGRDYEVIRDTIVGKCQGYGRLAQRVGTRQRSPRS